MQNHSRGQGGEELEQQKSWKEATAAKAVPSLVRENFLSASNSKSGIP